MAQAAILMRAFCNTCSDFRLKKTAIYGIHISVRYDIHG